MRRFEELSDGEKIERLERVAHKALLGYGLTGDLRHVASTTHTIFQLRTGGATYAVRVCAPGIDRAPLERELTWLAALGRDTRLRVPDPLLTLTGELSRSVSLEGVPGTRACMVLRWVDGERREAELTLGEAEAMGRFVAALHAHAEGFRWPDELALLYVTPAERALEAAEAVRGALKTTEDRARLCDLVAAVAEADAEIDARDVGILHGDLRLRKLRHEGGEVGALGFDACRVGAFAEDLSILWDELGAREMTGALRAALLNGYRSVRSLSPSAARALDAFVGLRDLQAAARELEASRPRTADAAATARATALVRRHAG